MRYIFLLLTSLCFCLSSFQAMSTHIIGGTIYYRYLQPNVYEVKLDYYKDCDPASLDFPPGDLKLGLFKKGEQTVLLSFLVKPRFTDTLNFIASNCDSNVQACVLRRTYTDTLDLSSIAWTTDTGYYFVFEQCCRYTEIKNIQFPFATGIVFYTEFAIPKDNNGNEFINSSPILLSEPNPFICNNELLEEKLILNDPDSDSLAFRILVPLQGNTDELNPNGNGLGDPMPGPYASATLANTYSATNLMDGNPDVTVDALGVIRVRPSQLGLYAFTLIIEEFRAGVKISEIRKDMQYSVFQCKQRNAPILTWTNTEIKNLVSNEERCFEFTGEDLDVTDSLTFYINEVASELQTSTIQFSIDRTTIPIKAQVCIDVPCSASIDTFKLFKIMLSDLSCPQALLDSLVLEMGIEGSLEEDYFEKIPNVFSPNNDGINDAFEVKNSSTNPCFNNFNISIYSRWGNKVFESNDIDFKWLAKDNDVGVYFYAIKIAEYEKVGNVLLIK